VVAVMDVLWLEHQQQHVSHDASPVHVDDELVAINGVSTMLLTGVEVEQLLLGPQGSWCVLTLASPRFHTPDGISMVELIRHDHQSKVQQALI